MNYLGPFESWGQPNLAPARLVATNPTEQQPPVFTTTNNTFFVNSTEPPTPAPANPPIVLVPSVPPPPTPSPEKHRNSPDDMLIRGPPMKCHGHGKRWNNCNRHQLMVMRSTDRGTLEPEWFGMCVKCLKLSESDTGNSKPDAQNPPLSSTCSAHPVHPTPAHPTPCSNPDSPAADTRPPKCPGHGKRQWICTHRQLVMLKETARGTFEPEPVGLCAKCLSLGLTKADEPPSPPDTIPKDPISSASIPIPANFTIRKHQLETSPLHTETPFIVAPPTTITNLSPLKCQGYGKRHRVCTHDQLLKPSKPGEAPEYIGLCVECLSLEVHERAQAEGKLPAKACPGYGKRLRGCNLEQVVKMTHTGEPVYIGLCLKCLKLETRELTVLDHHVERQYETSTYTKCPGFGEKSGRCGEQTNGTGNLCMRCLGMLNSTFGTNSRIKGCPGYGEFKGKCERYSPLKELCTRCSNLLICESDENELYINNSARMPFRRRSSGNTG